MHNKLGLIRSRTPRQYLTLFIRNLILVTNSDPLVSNYFYTEMLWANIRSHESALICFVLLVGCFSSYFSKSTNRDKYLILKLIYKQIPKFRALSRHIHMVCCFVMAEYILRSLQSWNAFKSSIQICKKRDTKARPTPEILLKGPHKMQTPTSGQSNITCI